MDIANCVSSKIDAVYFSVCDPEDVKKLSVKKIVNPQTLDAMDNPVQGGLYDPALGPSNKDSV
jgi:DNA-directed RNA polymerase I subunit RPA1